MVSAGEIADVVGISDCRSQLPVCHALREPRQILGVVAGGDTEDAAVITYSGRKGLAHG